VKRACNILSGIGTKVGRRGKTRCGSPDSFCIVHSNGPHMAPTSHVSSMPPSWRPCEAERLDRRVAAGRFGRPVIVGRTALFRLELGGPNLGRAGIILSSKGP